jgi:hypothetical protein
MPGENLPPEHLPASSGVGLVLGAGLLMAVQNEYSVPM